ncbi:MAG: signal peptidase I [Candidatus Planktophila sp.]|nr:signal peptidase I [Candidatus Planktophila sp.]MSO25240.1 signal peptidase I [Candidatus Planktophila sp.]
MSRKGSVLREFPILVIVALAVSLLIKTLLVQFFFIPSGSMENTLQVQDRVAVNKLPIISKDINRGDVVVFRDPDNWLPEAFSADENKIIAKIKEGLVLVGVLPNPAKQYLVKRVIGVAGDNVICCSKSGKLTINGKETTEPYIFAGNKVSEMDFNINVPEGKIWVMGDHRSASADSRYHQDDVNNGFVPVSRITGRAYAIIWPLKNIGIISSQNPIK